MAKKESNPLPLLHMIKPPPPPSPPLKRGTIMKLYDKPELDSKEFAKAEEDAADRFDYAEMVITIAKLNNKISILQAQLVWVRTVSGAFKNLFKVIFRRNK